jgi:2'-hydroxyisoflavone reductase
MPGCTPRWSGSSAIATGTSPRSAGRSWDAVVDTSGFVPRVVRQSCELLSGSVRTYVFVSTTGVYAETARIGCDETSPLRRLADETDDLETEDHVRFYGALKVLCEREVAAAFPGAAALLRPGPVVGPHDPSDRFTYWVRRAAAAGDAIAPGPPDRLVQHIDARDLMLFVVECVERGASGAYNAVAQPYTFAHFLEACSRVAGGDVGWVWADEEWLLANGVRGGSELPVWLPGPVNRGRLACATRRRRSPPGSRRGRSRRPPATRSSGMQGGRVPCTAGRSAAAATRFCRSNRHARQSSSGFGGPPHERPHEYFTSLTN